jgi:hypothetical protein
MTMPPDMILSSCGIGPKAQCVAMFISSHLALILHLWMRFVGLQPMKELHQGPICRSYKDALGSLMGP